MKPPYTQKPDRPWRKVLHEVIFEADTPAGKWFDIMLIICFVSKFWKFILILLLLASPLLLDHAFGKATRISMDGYFADWEQLAPIYGQGHSFFNRLWAANDERFLFLMIELGAEINLQNDNRLILYLDTDNNKMTGQPVNGIGAELEWNFGEKTGSFFIEKHTYSLRHSDIGLVIMPTISSTRFEIALDQNARPARQKLLFTHNTIAIALENKATGEVISATGQPITYTFDNSRLPPISPISLTKQDKNHLRVLTYNVLRDNLFKIRTRPQFSRILKAIQPDIIGFEEIYNHSAQQTAQLIESFVPSSRGQKWHGSKVDPDIVALSRYPIKKTFPIVGNGAFLIDLRPRYGSDLLLIVAHPPSGSRNASRQREIDAIMAFVREAKRRGGDLDLTTDTPILLIGDMNLVGYSQQLQTLITGEIINQQRYNPSFKPDWDGTAFTALLPRQTDLLMAYTWYNEQDNFSPGRLDYIIYSDSVLKPGNQFVLFTPEMAADTLARYGLKPLDAVQASDHLPVVGDFILRIFADPENEPFNLSKD